METKDAAAQFDDYMAEVKAAFSRVQKKMGEMKTNEKVSCVLTVFHLSFYILV